MKKKKLLLILLAVLFFLTALTLYLNRVVFPVQLKNFAVKEAENFLKRKVEIESLHFSWVKGLVVDKIKVYQKDSDQVFLQAQRVSLGVVWIPGLKQQRITIPFINIEQPSVHVVRSGPDQWNFSDLLAMAAPPASPAASTPSPGTEEKPSPFSITVTGINILDGKVRIDDVSGGKTWSELLDHVELKVGLSFSGVTFNTSLEIPQKQGTLSAQGNYQLLTQNLEAQVRIKNINPADYTALYDPAALVEGLQIKNGLIESVDGTINYSKESISVKGDAVIKNLDVSLADQAFKGSVRVRNSDFVYKNGALTLKGNFELDKGTVVYNGMSGSASVVAAITQLDYTTDSLIFDGDLQAQGLSAQISQGRSVQGSLALNKVKARQSKEGIQVIGALTAQDLNVQWDSQSFQGSVEAKPLTIEFKDANDITVTGDLELEHMAVAIDAQKSFKGTVTVNGLNLRVTEQKNVDFKGRVSVTQMDVVPAEGMRISGSVELPLLSLGFNNDILAVKTEGELNNWQVDLGEGKTIVAESDFSLNAIYPLSDPHKLQYDGTLGIHSAEAKGFACGPLPCGPLKEINLDAKFQTDQFKVKQLSLVVLGSAIKAAGTVMNFKSPALDFEAASDKIDLGLLKDILPEVFKTYGLSTAGEASFNVQFQGLVSNPLSGKINTKIQLRDVSVASSTHNQALSNVSGKIEGTLDTLSWENFTGIYQGNTYTLTGRLIDFKNPQITTSLDGKDVQLKTELIKQGNILNIKSLDGKYFNITFGANGSVDLSGAPVLDISSKISLRLEDVPAFLPPDQRKMVEPLNPTGAVKIEAAIKGKAADWKSWNTTGKITSDLVTVMGYSLNNVTLNLTQAGQKISDVTLDATVYDGKVHAVGSGDVSDAGMPFDLALNVDGVDLHKLKMDIPSLKSEEINGKFYLTTVTKGKLADIKNIEGKGSLGIREGFLTEFKLFKGLLSILNQVMRLGQVTITDVEGNFEIAGQKWTTDNLRLKSPTIVLLTQGWVNFDQDCDFNVTVDTTSGIVPAMAMDVLQTLKIHIYDKIGNPKFDHKISVPQVINTLLKNLPIFTQ